MNDSETRPLIALTMGDAAGIGPEVLVKAASSPEVRECCRPLAIGHAEVLQRAIHQSGLELSVIRAEVGSIHDFVSAEHVLPCLQACDDDVASVPLGVVDGRAGRAAYECLAASARLALAGQIDGITTAPLNKAALKAGGLNYPGHTEILGDICSVSEFGMMLYLPHSELIRSPNGLGVVHTTLHTSIRSVPGLLTTQSIASHIRLMDGFMRRVGCDVPRVAVCALNPHAGEDGLFGDEEATVIVPAVVRCRQEGIAVTGPLPADTLLRRSVSGEFDGVVAMYHDQGHIALKLIGFDRAVNITLGLPIVRTSPSHGTAFDIAGRGQASADGMIEAIKMAAILAKTK
jgi:4-phospho-D-threonate 3-dehydrogenase / 4-phospho-D-erythronate 3-dehydrogenase